jgi:hypothetical protein
VKREHRLVGLIAGDRGVDGAGEGVDAAGEGLSALEALGAEPHGDRERALAMVAKDDDVGVGVELGVGTGGDFAHRHQEGVGEVGRLEFPGLANVEEDGWFGGGSEGQEGLGGDFGVGGWKRIGHGVRIQGYSEELDLSVC